MGTDGFNSASNSHPIEAGSPEKEPAIGWLVRSSSVCRKLNDPG